MRAYLRVDPNLIDKKADYPDGAYRAFVDALCLAEQQYPRGRFRSRKLLAVLLGKRSRWIPYLIAHGDLIETPTGKLYIDGWDEWQEGDVTVSERMRRLRSRQRDVTPSDTPSVTPDVTAPSVYRPSSGGGSGRHISGDGAPYNGAANGQKREAKPGEHRGQHRDCSACEEAQKALPLKEQMDIAFQLCGECGVRQGAHRPTDHEWQPTNGVRS